MTPVLALCAALLAQTSAQLAAAPVEPAPPQSPVADAAQAPPAATSGSAEVPNPLRGSRVVAALAGGAAALAVGTAGWTATTATALGLAGLLAVAAPQVGITYLMGAALLVPAVLLPITLLTLVAAPLAGWLVGTAVAPRRVPALAVFLLGVGPGLLAALMGVGFYEGVTVGVSLLMLAALAFVYVIVAVLVSVLVTICGGEPSIPPLDFNKVRIPAENRPEVFAAAAALSLLYLVPAAVGHVAGAGAAAVILGLMGRGLGASESRFNMDVWRVPDPPEPLEDDAAPP